MKKLISIFVVLLLSGCGSSFRNEPRQQVEDMEICRKGGMDAFSTLLGEVKCAPKKVESK